MIVNEMESEFESLPRERCCCGSTCFESVERRNDHCASSIRVKLGIDQRYSIDAAF